MLTMRSQFESEMNFDIFQNFYVLYETRSDAWNVSLGTRLNASKTKNTF